jgi:hypothetical protein
MMSWAGHVAHERAKRNSYRIVVENPTTIKLHKPGSPIRPIIGRMHPLMNWGNV